MAVPQAQGQAEPTFNLAQVMEMMQNFAKELKKPYIDEEKAARDLRDQKKSRDDYRQGQAMEKAAQAACPHKFKTGAWAISLMHNFPDGQRRGVCNKCKDLIQPRHIEIAYDPLNPNGRPIWVPEHRLYPLLAEIAFSNSQV